MSDNIITPNEPEIAQPKKKRHQKAMKTDISYKTRMGINVPAVKTIQKYDLLLDDLHDCLKKVDRSKGGKNRQTRIRALEKYLGVEEDVPSFVATVNVSILCEGCRCKVVENLQTPSVHVAKSERLDHGLEKS